MLPKSYSPLKEVNKKSKAFFYFRNLKDNRVKIHFNLIACLAGAHLIFLTGIKSAVSCKVSSLDFQKIKRQVLRHCLDTYDLPDI